MGSRYILDWEIPSSKRAARARSKALRCTGTVTHGASRGHAEGLLVHPAIVVDKHGPGRFVGTREPRANHDRPGACSKGKSNIAGVTHPTVSPDGTINLSSSLGALQHCRKLRTPHPGLHPSGAHGARSDADLDDVRTRLQQIEGAACG